ncbi:MAG: right-handed parallel beta-helix repeat-containing protein, partial [Candidatus Omnitrophica bacterium]|nr:right-handed parallel beta-helix repeat-containing protein [Candidatus Omnitrophota bacterium]
MSDKKRLMGYYSTDNKNSLLYDLKRLFKDLYSFARNLISHPKPCQIRVTHGAQRKMGSVPILLTFLTIILVFISFALYLPKAQSSGIFLNQTDWSGGAREGMVATESDWLNYDSADAEIDVSQAGNITLALIEGLFEDTTSDHFKEGTLDETLVISDGGISLSHPIRVNEYTVGTMPRISVTASNISGSDPWTIVLNSSPDLSRIFKSDKFTDSTGRVYKILSVSDVKDTIIVIDSEGLAAAPSAGAATVGRWFTTLAAWEGAREGDITVNGQDAIERALCYADGSGPGAGAIDTSTPTIDGWTTDEEHYIEIIVPKSERHTGVWTLGAYTLSTSSNAPNLFVHADYTKVRGLQVESQSEGRHYAVRVAAAGVEVTDNIIKGANMASMKNWNFGILLSEDSDANVANNIIYHFKSSGKKGRGIVGGKNSDARVYNNTIYGCDVGLDRGLGGGTWITQNNISYRNKNNFHGEFEATSRNNLSGPVEGGAPGLKAVNKTFVDFLDEDGLDFHLNALDAHARNGGANLITDELFAFAQDIDGAARPMPTTSGDRWDIGADEA